MPFVELGRDLDADLDVEIALAVSVQHRYALVADAEGCARLSTVGDFQHVFAVHGGHPDLRAHGSLCDRYWDHTVQVVALAREEGMLLHMQHYV